MYYILRTVALMLVGVIGYHVAGCMAVMGISGMMIAIIMLIGSVMAVLLARAHTRFYIQTRR